MFTSSSILPVSVKDATIDEYFGGNFIAAFRRTMWICSAAIGFGILVMIFHGINSGIEFFAGYLVEQTLSVDNLFVFILLFDYFRVPVHHQSRVLLWGIIGAVIMRGIMIGLGVAAIKRSVLAWFNLKCRCRFSWAILVFAGILVISSVRLLREQFEHAEFQNGNHTDEVEGNLIMKLSKYFIRSTEFYDGDKFLTRNVGTLPGKLHATPLLMCLICIELSDFVFAVDSIPAVLGISHDPIIVYSSNIFAIMGLRSLYTIIARAITDMSYLKPAVAMVLGFVGVKMMLEYFDFRVSTLLSLFVICTLLGSGMGLSYIMKKKDVKKDDDIIQI